jgi:hypothetical protein
MQIIDSVVRFMYFVDAGESAPSGETRVPATVVLFFFEFVRYIFQAPGASGTNQGSGGKCQFSLFAKANE